MNTTTKLKSMATLLCVLWHVSAAGAEDLLDDKWTDGGRSESNRPMEAAVWVGREADVTVKPGALTTVMTPASQKIWTYFTEQAPVTLEMGQTLTASVSFIPRGTLSAGTSRSLRIGLFHDPTDLRVESDVNNDAGGNGMPWRDARGYAVQVLMAGGEYSSTKPFDLGKRINLQSPSLLGTSGDYAKVSGGQPVALEPDKQYTVTLEVERVSESQVELTASYKQGDEELSSWSVADDGNYLGTEPGYDKFDLLFIRIANNTTTADKIEFTNFKVAVTLSEVAKQ
ncbi:MAG: hypothetical protein WD738_13615 [Pirellulales bacterium]